MCSLGLDCECIHRGSLWWGSMLVEAPRGYKEFGFMLVEAPHGYNEFGSMFC